MKYLLYAAVALQGVAAFPAVPSVLDSSAEIERRAAQAAKPGCSVSKLCDKKVPISDAEIGYDPKNLTPTQKILAKTPLCGAAQGPCLVFNENQLVSTSGEHAYRAPTKDQIRGPCPGLNAAANHGYLHRSGVSSIPNSIFGLGQLYGMSVDLAGFLAAYAIAFDGDVISETWSIGGPPPTAKLSKGLLGEPQGISYSHNKYEGDSSIGRCDAYINDGDAHSLSVQKFKYAYESGMDNDRYNFFKFDVAFTKNALRSEKTNPAYFAPLFSTTLVSPAAYHFVATFMSNHTAENPNGYLNGAMFKSFFAIEGDYPNFKWKPGQERVPDNWYRRTLTNEYNAVAGVFGDLATEFAAFPKSFRFGGNVNGTSTYTGIDISNFTNGVYNIDTLFQGNNLACFFYENEQQAIPDALEGGANPKKAAIGLVTKYLTSAFGHLTCPKLGKLNDNSLSQYPGRKYSPKSPKKTAVNC